MATTVDRPPTTAASPELVLAGDERPVRIGWIESLALFVVFGVGYALLLAAVMLALRREPTPQGGLIVGIAGFLAVALAPAIGLPPELPGMGAAPLVLRQAWWLMTVVATGLGPLSPEDLAALARLARRQGAAR